MHTLKSHLFASQGLRSPKKRLANSNLIAIHPHGLVVAVATQNLSKALCPETLPQAAAASDCAITGS